MKELKDYSELELKAFVYDDMARIEVSQNNIKIVNQELQRRASLPKGETKTKK